MKFSIEYSKVRKQLFSLYNFTILANPSRGSNSRIFLKILNSLEFFQSFWIWRCGQKTHFSAIMSIFSPLRPIEDFLSLNKCWDVKVLYDEKKQIYTSASQYDSLNNESKQIEYFQFLNGINGIQGGCQPRCFSLNCALLVETFSPTGLYPLLGII